MAIKNKILFSFTVIIIAAINVFAQQQDLMQVTGSRGTYTTVNGEMIQEVFAPVVITQGNVRITCDHAIRYISKNVAELIGNVVATQDTLTITTSHGYYYGDERIAESNTGVRLTDKKVVLTADSGDYYFNEDKAIFNSNVKLVDTSSTLTSDNLVYYKNTGKAIASGKVKIVESKDIIQADSLVHFRDSRITFADSRVRISSKTNNSIIFGNHLEDYPEKYYTLVNKNPIFIQIDSSYIKEKDTSKVSSSIDTAEVLKIDTLVIKAMKMEAYRDTINLFKAEDSVRIVRGAFASRNDFTEYFRGKGEIVTVKISENSKQPIIWYENSQLTGDSVSIYLIDNKINMLDVDKDAFILSQNAKYKNRFDQISGSRIKIHFGDDGIEETDVHGGVHSIYYLYDNNEPNGLNKSSSESAKILFEDKKVSTVKLYGTPMSEYYPERKVAGIELSFTLPGFLEYKDRPVKNDLLKSELTYTKSSAINDKSVERSADFNK